MAFTWDSTSLPALASGGWRRPGIRGVEVMEDVIPKDGAAARETINYSTPYPEKRDIAVCREKARTVYDTLVAACKAHTQKTLVLPDGTSYTAEVESITDFVAEIVAGSFLYGDYTVTFVEA